MRLEHEIETDGSRSGGEDKRRTGGDTGIGDPPVDTGAFRGPADEFLAAERRRTDCAHRS
ncbi:hypothetical protein ACQPXB_22150 [Amycolatopsis sp. CA-161197]|uniref:hypothetical protein n=1 Tax=unclassified Amycolatopsis TaxID=2618356 RepID=UPI0034520189